VKIISNIFDVIKRMTLKMQKTKTEKQNGQPMLITFGGWCSLTQPVLINYHYNQTNIADSWSKKEKVVFKILS